MWFSLVHLRFTCLHTTFCHPCVFESFMNAPRRPYMGMGTLCTGKKAPVYGQGGHFALAKRPPYMGTGTLCTGKKAPIYGHGDTLHWQKGPHIWAWGHFALAKRG